MPHFGEFTAPATTSYAVIPSYGWNPADKSPNIVLSGGDSIATLISTGSQGGSIRGVTGHNAATADRYFEVQMNTTATFVQMLGVGRTNADLNNFPGIDPFAWSYYSHNGERYNNSAGTAYGATFAALDVIGVWLKNGDLRFFKNGVDQGLAFSGLTGTLFPMWGPATFGAGTRSALLNTGTGPFLSLPTGAVAWG